MQTEKAWPLRAVQMVHNVLSGAMGHVVRMELISRNPVGLVSPSPNKEKEASSPDIDSVRRLLAIAEEEEHHLWACIHLIANTGMRRGEAIALVLGQTRNGRCYTR